MQGQLQCLLQISRCGNCRFGGNVNLKKGIDKNNLIVYNQFNKTSCTQLNVMKLFCC